MRQPPSSAILFSTSLGHSLATSRCDKLFGDRLSGTASRGLLLGIVSGTLSRECLSGVSLDRFSGRNSGFLGPDHPRPNSAGVSRSYPHDFFSPLFLASLKSRSETPLFRAWNRKTSQNGGQNRPKSGPLGVRNRCYVARAEM